MAESEGFEPPDPFGSTVFKTAAFDRSASSPFVLFGVCRYSVSLSDGTNRVVRRVVGAGWIDGRKSVRNAGVL